MNKYLIEKLRWEEHCLRNIEYFITLYRPNSIDKTEHSLCPEVANRIIALFTSSMYPIECEVEFNEDGGILKIENLLSKAEPQPQQYDSNNPEFFVLPSPCVVNSKEPKVPEFIKEGRGFRINTCEGLHPTEARNPKQSERFKELLEEAYRTYLDKNQDYSPANAVYTGEIGIIVREWDKFCRICNLNGIEFPVVKPDIDNLIDAVENRRVPQDCDGGDFTEMVNEMVSELKTISKKCEFNWKDIKPKDAVNEPLADAWKDMAVYAFIGLLVHEGVWGR